MNWFNMSTQIHCLGNYLPQMLPLNGFFPSWTVLIWSFQRLLFSKTCITKITFKWLLPFMNWSNMHFQMLCLRNSINLKHFYILHILGSPFIGFALHLTAHHWPRKNESSKRQIQNTEAQSVRIDCRDFSRFRIFFAITCMNWPNLYIPSTIKTQINPIYFDAFWPVQL